MASAHILRKFTMNNTNKSFNVSRTVNINVVVKSILLVLSLLSHPTTTQASSPAFITTTPPPPPSSLLSLTTNHHHQTRKHQKKIPTVYHDRRRFFNPLLPTNYHHHHRSPSLIRRMGWPFSTTESSSSYSSSLSADSLIVIGKKIGSGSYGTVHLCHYPSTPNDVMIAKRCWDEFDFMNDNDVVEPHPPPSPLLLDDDDDDATTTTVAETTSAVSPSERAERCRRYLDVERHCFEKMCSDDDDGQSSSSSSSFVPRYRGTFFDTDSDKSSDGGRRRRSWLVFSLVSAGTDDDGDDTGSHPAMTLADAMTEDDDLYHSSSSSSFSGCRLRTVGRALGLMNDDVTEAEVLDVVFLELLRTLAFVNQKNIVHRDVKPANLLCDARRQSLVLIDFGSAADMDPPANSLSAALGLGSGGRVGLDGDIVAVSPIYAAPEVFVRWDRGPLNFDTFSCALVFCQLVFHLLDERTDASFRQQLEDAKYDLDGWLEEELISTIRPAGLEDGINYLGERKGLWKLLKDMLHPNPEIRISTRNAFDRFSSILTRVKELEKDGSNRDVIDDDDDDDDDGESFFDTLLASYGECDISELFDDDDAMTTTTTTTTVDVSPSTVTTTRPIISLPRPRPLHFVATFDRSLPLGLVLSEVSNDDDDDDDDEESQQWEMVTKTAKEGEVYIKEIVENGQADDMGIFEIGDRVRAIGEIQFNDDGFERVVDMISRQPKSSKTISLHFDRLPTSSLSTIVDNDSINDSDPSKIATIRALRDHHDIKIIGQGACSSRGRREAQEDAYLLHELGPSLRLAGIFDGHGGTAASSSASQLLPTILSSSLSSSRDTTTTSSSSLSEQLTTAWDDTCTTYRQSCFIDDGDDSSSCVASYDPRDGRIMAQMGAKDIVAGTTATMALYDMTTSELILLNCGDSRGLVIRHGDNNDDDDDTRTSKTKSSIAFATRDHIPGDPDERQRLRQGPSSYATPKCSFGSRWRLPVGDYQYAVSRSLEGAFATELGIVSTPDVTVLRLEEMMMTSSNDNDDDCHMSLVMASDGLFEVMDNEEVGRRVRSLRGMGLTADDVAKELVRLALDKGTRDNVSVVVMFFS